MRFYSYETIKDSITCQDAAALIGIEIRNGRCAATWRGGDNPNSVAVENTSWYDHVAKKGGSVIDLVAVARFGGDTMAAQSFLG